MSAETIGPDTEPTITRSPESPPETETTTIQLIETLAATWLKGIPTSIRGQDSVIVAERILHNVTTPRGSTKIIIYDSIDIGEPDNTRYEQLLAVEEEVFKETDRIGAYMALTAYMRETAGKNLPEDVAIKRKAVLRLVDIAGIIYREGGDPTLLITELTDALR